MSLHAFDENCENLILFEFFVFSQGVSFLLHQTSMLQNPHFRHLTFWMDLRWMA